MFNIRKLFLINFTLKEFSQFLSWQYFKRRFSRLSSFSPSSFIRLFFFSSFHIVCLFERGEEEKNLKLGDKQVMWKILLKTHSTPLCQRQKIITTHTTFIDFLLRKKTKIFTQKKWEKNTTRNTFYSGRYWQSSLLNQLPLES